MPRGTVIATTLALGVGMASLAGASGAARITRGWVSAVDAGTRTIKVKGKNDEVSFRVLENGKVLDHDRAATFAALSPGEHVMVLYTGSETDRLASEVRILASPQAESAPAGSIG